MLKQIQHDSGLAYHHLPSLFRGRSDFLRICDGINADDCCQEDLWHVQHHFVDSDQQFDSAKLGMWVFLVNEILFFGGLFCAYIIFRVWYPELFTQSALELNKLWGGVNTVVLIGSSLTVAMAIRSAQRNEIRGLRINLLITIALACVFMDYLDR